MFRAFDLVNEVGMVIFKVLIADCAIVVIGVGLFVAFELSLSPESSIAIWKGARNVLGVVLGSHRCQL